MNLGKDEHLETALYIWFKLKREEGVPITGSIIRAKALDLHRQLHSHSDEMEGNEVLLIVHSRLLLDESGDSANVTTSESCPCKERNFQPTNQPQIKYSTAMNLVCITSFSPISPWLPHSRSLLQVARHRKSV